MAYVIVRYKKDKTEVKILSQNKRRWLPVNSKHRSCSMTEAEADAYIKKKGNNCYYYFLKTLK